MNSNQKSYNAKVKKIKLAYLMKKILLTILLILVLWIWGYFAYINIIKMPKVVSNWEKPPIITNTGIISNKDKIIEQIKEVQISKKEKIEQLKRRSNFKAVIRKWDFYSIKNMKETALQYYLTAYRKLPNDHVIEKKIAETYFEMKDFKMSYDYYIRIPDSEIDWKLKDKILKTLLYTGEKNMRDEFSKIKWEWWDYAYYDKVLVCYTWIKNCIQEIKAFSWSSSKLDEIKKTFIDYENVTHGDSNSKYAALAWIFFKNKDYLAAALIWEETLKYRSDYSSVLKITWYSWYELGHYKKANDYLQKYYQLEPKDITVTYLLGIINFYLENYISSNLYFNAAVLNWFTPKAELQKRLAYNYYIIWDKKNMIKVFRYILDEDETTPDDYSVALFVSIEEKEYSKAMLWANKWIKRFPDADMLYAFRWWLYNIREEQINALNDLNMAASLNPNNAVALYNLWLISFEKNDMVEAKRYFEKTEEFDKNWPFWNKASDKLKEVERKIKEEEKLNEEIIIES